MSSPRRREWWLELRWGVDRDSTLTPRPGLDACVPVAQPVVADNPVGNSATYPLTVERGGCRLRCYRDATSLSKEENDGVVARS